MKLKQWIQIILVSSSILALTACATKHNRGSDTAAISSANSSYGGAKVAGLGSESRFGSANGERIASKDVYYFDFDSNVVHDNDKSDIAAKSERLVANREKIMLEGHTDPRGSREYNIGLGERRAQAVAGLMREKGVDPSQIRVVSYGAQKLATPDHSEAAYQRDRRAVVVNLQR